jgi:HEAT repeat protein
MLPILRQALQNEDSTIRAKAALALEEIGTPDALKAVKEYESRQ